MPPPCRYQAARGSEPSAGSRAKSPERSRKRPSYRFCTTFDRSAPSRADFLSPAIITTRPGPTRPPWATYAPWLSSRLRNYVCRSRYPTPELGMSSPEPAEPVCGIRYVVPGTWPVVPGTWPRVTSWLRLRRFRHGAPRTRGIASPEPVGSSPGTLVGLASAYNRRS